MKSSDMFKLLSSPFRRRTLNRKPELPARMIDLGLTEPVRVAHQKKESTVSQKKIRPRSQQLLMYRLWAVLLTECRRESRG